MIKYILEKYIHLLRIKKRKEFNRSVSMADLLTERSSRAKFENFGVGTTIYDNVLILDKVIVGKNTWVGPNVILDGSGGLLQIGDNCTIGSGVQIYTHDSSNWAVSGGKSDYKKLSTKIGNNVFIGPNSVIKMGISVGNNVKIQPLSFVDKDIESGSLYLSNNSEIKNKYT